MDESIIIVTILNLSHILVYNNYMGKVFMIIHVVKSGESIFEIANFYGVNMQRLITDNGLQSINTLVTGQTIVILFPVQIHTVTEGETMESVVAQYGISTTQLLQNNPTLIERTILIIGEELVITYEEKSLGLNAVNGYAYQYINELILRKALPYITYLTIFGYGFTLEGELIPTEDEMALELALASEVAPIMLLSSVTEEGTFSTEKASILFGDVAMQNRLIENILETMNEKNYFGLDLDFEFVKSEDKNNFISFIRNVTTKLNANGFSVNVDLAPKTSSDQPGLLYEAHDYEQIGSIVNTVLLMTYEWGYAFGPPMAVAPINQVRRVVEYAVSVINPKKIYMGIPNYGYDWPLPFVQGTTEAMSIGNVEAVDIARKYSATILYDEEAQSPYFNYTDESGIQHIVWFEDARSIEAKLNLIYEFGLLGGGYWNLMRLFPQNWLVLNNLYTIVKVL